MPIEMQIEEEFFGRFRELELLEQLLAGERGAFVPVYGRRRVGKSQLILRFLEGKRAIYHVGKQVARELLLVDFMQAAGEALDDSVLALHVPRNWGDAIRVVEERWKGPGKLIIALDEFQWTVESSPELPSILQECWDRRWQKGGVMLILCGSYIGFMEREVLGRKSPLFGRRSAQILLRPFSFAESALFHPHYSMADRARAYFICGGIPFYLRCFSERKSIEQNIADVIFDDRGSLQREPEFLLREELREVANYHSILMALSNGSSANSEISSATGIGDRTLHFYLTTLMELGYVQRRHPLNGTPASKRQTRYRVGDPLLRFWFHFVFPNLGRIAVLGARKAVATLVTPQLDAFFGHAFERLCRESLPWLYESEGVSAAFEIGEFWDKETQIDVVGLRKDKWIDLGECKWGAARSARSLREELEPRISRFPNPKGATVGLRYFTRDKIKLTTKPPAHEKWHCLADLYAAAEHSVQKPAARKRAKGKKR